MFTTRRALRVGVTATVLGIAMSGLALAGGCKPPEAVKLPDQQYDDETGQANEKVDVSKAKAHISEAVTFLKMGALKKARAELTAAGPHADETRREEISRIRQSIDEAQAERSIPKVLELAKSGKCETAVKRALKASDEGRGTAVPTFIKKRTSGALLTCLLNQLIVDLSIGRELAADKGVMRALSKSDYQALKVRVTDATVKTLIARFEKPIEEREWAAAKALLDELVLRKEAGDDEYNRIMTLIRKGLVKDVLEKVAEGLDNKLVARDRLREVEAMIDVAEWGVTKGSAVGAEEMPASVATGRSELAFTVTCAALACRTTTPSEIWSFGIADVMPVLDPRKGKSLASVKHGTKVYKLAESASWVLIALVPPGSVDTVAERLKAAKGWVKRSQTKAKDTREMLPPGDSIVGTRIWGPLRTGQSEWELGRVSSVDGRNLTVERVADLASVTIARSQVRFGTVSKGTKVLARCQHMLKLEPAVIDRVVFPTRGDAIATITCLDEKGGRSSLTKKEQLGALRTKSQWIPR